MTNGPIRTALLKPTPCSTLTMLLRSSWATRSKKLLPSALVLAVRSFSSIPAWLPARFMPDAPPRFRFSETQNSPPFTLMARPFYTKREVPFPRRPRSDFLLQGFPGKLGSVPSFGRPQVSGGFQVMKRSIARALNIDSDLIDRALLLCFCLFLIISCVVIGKVARDALFLARFLAVQLPYADIASGVLVGFVVAAYLRIGRYVVLGTLLVGSQVFFAANCIFFWILAHFFHPIWLFPVFYIWVGMFSVLAPTQVWTLANYLLSTREAKKVFGVVAAGGISGWIFAGFVSKSAAHAFGTESLLFAMTPLLLLSSLLTRRAWRTTTIQLSDSEESTEGIAAQRDVRGSIRLVLSSPYLRAIAIVICVSNLVTMFTAWQFKAIAKQSFANKDVLAAFFGSFYLYAGLLALVFQFLLTTRLLRRFGIATMLFLMPVIVLIGSAGLLISGTLTAVVLLKGSDQVLRYSIDRATVELLYLPLSARLKLQAKWFIDTVVWRFGDGLAGILVLIFATYLHWPPQQLSWIALALVAIWLVAVAVSGKQYLLVLRDSITQHQLSAEQTSALAL